MHTVFIRSSCLLLVVLYCRGSQAIRYRTCDEGCCVHEYCAFQRICYPKIHCRFGCPDGRCVGQDTPTTKEGVTEDTGTSASKFTERSKENYLPLYKGSNQGYDDRRLGARSGIQIVRRSKPEETTAHHTGDMPSGICMPDPPCKPTDYCGMAHVCSMNYNLGYRTCQYNLDIGSTLCFDSKGNLNLKPMKK
ncbi:hypothetical protein Bpfe_021938 [Biomphalaria pfeifferi]|uniref:Chitin-binding type-2 domain-containing protein n=1 Tax=Biomphalaria pfeifferi TaxID=112525 RepID=A0AAD8B608_BIOPF|nr:hypothetical protein Bpfe_021938 [Biomphalaria pfeifferi]